MTFAVIQLKKILLYFAVIICVTLTVCFTVKQLHTPQDVYLQGGIPRSAPVPLATAAPKEYIKWVEFDVTYKMLEKTYLLDTGSQGKLNWIDILAYLGAKYGGTFSKYKENDLTELVNRLESGEKIEDIVVKMKYFEFYREAYTAILGEFIGEYSVELYNDDTSDLKVWHKKYGLKVFSPIAEGYDFSHYDDFGNSRSYGYKRRHLGHDLIGSTGTPIAAIESGRVEVLGWNQYGGWRVGMRSFDGKRYYYYAHLRKDHPFQQSLKEGDIVKAGDIIGYLGRTGYSTTENVNNIDTPHLHVGMQLIFDESQKESENQIWIDMYAIIRLLQRNKVTVYRDIDSKEYFRKYNFHEALLESVILQQNAAELSKNS